jgi:hypothetical protein
MNSGKVWKEAVKAQFDVTSRSYLHELRKPRKYVAEDSPPPGQDLKTWLPVDPNEWMGELRGWAGSLNYSAGRVWSRLTRSLIPSLGKESKCSKPPPKKSPWTRSWADSRKCPSLFSKWQISRSSVYVCIYIYIRSRKPKLTAVRIRCADHVTSSVRKCWH